MKNVNIFLMVGLVGLVLLTGLTQFGTHDKSKNFDGYSALNFDNNVLDLPVTDFLTDYNGAGSNSTGLDNDSGCCSVVVDVGPGHDVVSYRRDSNNSADTIIENLSFSGQNALHEYKKQGGYFTHVIITQSGWIICIGGKDDPDINKMLEKLGSEIVSRGTIQKQDINNANAIIKEHHWGHILIKSPHNNVPVTSYDGRIPDSPANMTDMFKLNDGDYVKLANNPSYFVVSKYNETSTDPVDAAIKIVGRDTFGLDRRDVTSYEFINNSTTSRVSVWASFDGGAMTGAHGYPDNVIFYGNETPAKELPTIPDKKFLGEHVLYNNTPKSSASSLPLNSGMSLVVIVSGLFAGIFLVQFMLRR
ncbi:MAG: hypothetical protein F8N15_09690 [Methanobacterium sp.]|nr:hypothetical protein [Methanobacterium sp.]